MSVDIETEVKLLLQKIKADIPRDENGYYPNGFFSHYDISAKDSLASSVYDSLDLDYYMELVDKVDVEILTGSISERLSGSLLTLIDSKLTIPSVEQCLGRLLEINSMWKHLEKRVESKLLDILEKCLRYAWAIYYTTSSDRSCRMAAYTLLDKHLTDIYRICCYALDAELEPATPVQAPEQEAEEEKPAPAQEDDEERSEMQVFIMKVCDRIFATSSNRDGRGQKGPYYVVEHKNHCIKTGDAVYKYVNNHLSEFEGSKWPNKSSTPGTIKGWRSSWKKGCKPRK